MTFYRRSLNEGDWMITSETRDGPLSFQRRSDPSRQWQLNVISEGFQTLIQLLSLPSGNPTENPAIGASP
jgi:hypothetical protein